MKRFALSLITIVISAFFCSGVVALGEGDLKAIAAEVMAVSPLGRLATAWGQVKNGIYPVGELSDFNCRPLEL